jgi:hypothetical protein
VATHRLAFGIAATFALGVQCRAHSNSTGEATSSTPSVPRHSQVACFPTAHLTSDHLSIFKGASSAVAFLAQVYDKPPRVDSEKDARAFICELFAESRSQARGEKPAPLCTVGEGFFQATTDGLDGTWHVIGLPSEVFVVMYEPPQRGSEYPDTTWTLRQEGRFAIHEILQPAFVCPSDKTQICVSWSPHRQYEEESPSQTDNTAREFFCPDEQALPCEQHGYNSEFYVVDSVSTRTVRIGPLERVDLPQFTAASTTHQLTVAAPDCTQEISF